MPLRVSSRVTAVSWIPSEAADGLATRAAFATVGHYDDPPPDHIAGDDTQSQGLTLDRWRDEDRFRFANQLGAWIQAADGAIVDAGYDGTGRIGSTTLAVRSRSLSFAATPMPIIQSPVELGTGEHGAWARFEQTWGGRTGVPAPRRVNHPPFVQLSAPLAWSTLSLVIHADGHVDHEVVGASPFPRHWIYGPTGDLVAKTGRTDFRDWWRHAFGTHSPWGDTESPAFVAAAESAAERLLAANVMHGRVRPRLRKLPAGHRLTQQGDLDSCVYLVLDGMLTVEVDGEVVAEIGPGAIVGERAVLEGGARTATVHTSTPCRVAMARIEHLAPEVLSEISDQHRREGESQGGVG